MRRLIYILGAAVIVAAVAFILGIGAEQEAHKSDSGDYLH